MRSRAIASYLAADKVGSKLICAMGHLERLAAWIRHIRIAHEDAACARCITLQAQMEYFHSHRGRQEHTMTS